MRPLSAALCALLFSLAGLVAPAPAAAEVEAGKFATAEFDATAEVDAAAEFEAATAIEAAADLREQDAPPASPDTLPRGFGARSPRTLPESGYTLVDTHRFDQAAAGFRFRYQGQGRPTVDAFIYPMAVPGSEMADTTRARLVDEQFERGLYEIEVYAERDERTLDTSLDPWSYEVETRHGPVLAHHRRIGFIERDDRRFDAHLVVLGVDLTYVKFRTTFPEERREEGQAHLEALIHELMPQLMVGEEAARAEAEAPATPPELPDAFDFRLPSRFEGSRFQVTNAGRVQSPEGGLGLTLQGPERPQIYLLLYELTRPAPNPWEGIPNEERLARLQSEFEEQVNITREAIAGTAGGVGELSETETFELETRYGTAPGLRATLETTRPDGEVMEIHLRMISVENAHLFLRGFVPRARRADLEGHIDAFLTELGSVLLVTHPPPGEDPEDGGTPGEESPGGLHP